MLRNYPKKVRGLIGGTGTKTTNYNETKTTNNSKTTISKIKIRKHQSPTWTKTINKLELKFENIYLIYYLFLTSFSNLSIAPEGMKLVLVIIAIVKCARIEKAVYGTYWSYIVCQRSKRSMSKYVKVEYA